MTLVAVSDRMLRIVFLVAAGSPLSRIENLRGSVVATIAPMTITAQVAADALAAHGLRPGHDVVLRHDRTPFNTVQSVLLGEAAAAAFPDVSLPALPADMRDQVHVIYRSRELPSIAFLARRSADLPDVDEIRQAILRFARETAEGREFVKAFGYDGLHAPDFRALRLLDRYLPELKRQMGTS